MYAVVNMFDMSKLVPFVKHDLDSLLHNVESVRYIQNTSQIRVNYLSVGQKG